jgi:hypothetical protein
VRRRFIDGFVIAAGCGALAAEIGILLALAYLGGGHPPASGLAAALLLLVMGPISAVAAILGLSAPQRGDGKLLFVMTGVNLAFAVFAAVLFVLKGLLGRSI